MNKTELKLIGQTYRKLREEQKLKREHIAKKCSVSPGSVAKMEQGNIDVGIGRFIGYLNVLGFSLSEFGSVYEKVTPPPAK